MQTSAGTPVDCVGEIGGPRAAGCGVRVRPEVLPGTGRTGGLGSLRRSPALAPMSRCFESKRTASVVTTSAVTTHFRASTRPRSPRLADAH